MKMMVNHSFSKIICDALFCCQQDKKVTIGAVLQFRQALTSMKKKYPFLPGAFKQREKETLSVCTAN